MKDKTAPGLREDRITAALLALGAAAEGFRPGRAHRGWLAAVPIVIVNYVAFRAQLRFWQAHLDRADALLVSVALESIAVYLTWLAHQALIEDDAALRPRLAAYGMALVIGVLNYSHYCKPGWRPDVAAVTFGMMSVISPWLWSAYSRRVSRPALKSVNLIEDHAVRLGITRWMLHAYRCTRVMHRATWKGENRPAEAIQLVYPDHPELPRPEAAAPQSPPSAPRTREPRSGPAAAARGRAARGRGLTAAQIRAEGKVAADLIRSGDPLPAQRQLARDLAEHKVLGGVSEMTRRRSAKRILEQASAELDDGDVRDRA